MEVGDDIEAGMMCCAVSWPRRGDKKSGIAKQRASGNMQRNNTMIIDKHRRGTIKCCALAVT